MPRSGHASVRLLAWRVQSIESIFELGLGFVIVLVTFSVLQTQVVPVGHHLV